MMSSLYKKKAPKISHQDTHVYRYLFRPEIPIHVRSRHDHDFEKDLNVYKSSLNQQAKGQGVFLHITGVWLGRRSLRRSACTPSFIRVRVRAGGVEAGAAERGATDQLVAEPVP